MSDVTTMRLRSPPHTALPGCIATAAYQGDVAAVRAWLDGSGHPDARQRKCGGTLLMGASAGGHELLLVMLLGRGASLDLQSKGGVSALMVAAVAGKPTVVLLLLHAGARTDLHDIDGNSALQIADIVASETTSPFAERQGAAAEVAYLLRHCNATPPPRRSGGVTTVDSMPAQAPLPEKVFGAATYGDVAAVVGWLDEGGQGAAEVARMLRRHDATSPPRRLEGVTTAGSMPAQAPLPEKVFGAATSGDVAAVVGWLDKGGQGAAEVARMLRRHDATSPPSRWAAMDNKLDVPSPSRFPFTPPDCSPGEVAQVAQLLQHRNAETWAAAVKWSAAAAASEAKRVAAAAAIAAAAAEVDAALQLQKAIEERELADTALQRATESGDLVQLRQALASGHI